MRFTKYAGFHEMLREKGAAGVAEYLAKNGISYYEPCQTVDGKTKPELDTEEARRLAKEGKFKLECYTMYINLWRGDREAIVTDAKYNLNLAKELGAKYYHQTIAPGEFWERDDNPSYEEIFQLVYPSVLEIAKHALSLGITPIFEPQGMYFNGIKGLGRLLSMLDKDVGEGKVGVLFDAGNCIYCGDRPLDLLREFMPRIKHVHLKDYRIAGEGENGYNSIDGTRYIDCLAGDGIIELEECVRYLEKHGYRGSYSSEVLVDGYDWTELDRITFSWLGKIINN